MIEQHINERWTFQKAVGRRAAAMGFNPMGDNAFFAIALWHRRENLSLDDRGRWMKTPAFSFASCVLFKTDVRVLDDFRVCGEIFLDHTILL